LIPKAESKSGTAVGRSRKHKVINQAYQGKNNVLLPPAAEDSWMFAQTQNVN